MMNSRTSFLDNAGGTSEQLKQRTLTMIGTTLRIAQVHILTSRQLVDQHNKTLTT